MKGAYVIHFAEEAWNHAILAVFGTGPSGKVLDEGVGPTFEMLCTPIVQKKMPISIIILV